MAEGDSVKTASVEIEANITVNEDSLTDLKAKLADATQVDAAPRTETRAKRGKTDVQADVEAKVDGKKLEADIQHVLDGDFRLSLDKVSLRAQVEEALSKAFTIQVNAEFNGGQRQDYDSRPAASRTVERGPAPAELEESMKKYGQVIDALHASLSDAAKSMGKAFGTALTPIDKMTEILDTFGAGSFEDLLKLEKTKGLPKAVGGALSRKSLEAQGYDPEHAKDIENQARRLTSGAGENLRTSEAQILIKRLTQWTATGSTDSPQYRRTEAEHEAQRERPTPGVSSAYREPAAGPNRPEPANTELKAAFKTLQSSLKKLPFQDVTDVDYSAKYPVNRTRKPRGAKPYSPEQAASFEKALGQIDEAIGALMGDDEGRKLLTAGPGSPRSRTRKRPVPGSVEARLKELGAMRGVLSRALMFNSDLSEAQKQSGEYTPPRRDDDPEATLRAFHQLGPGERANNRRLIGGFTPRSINGINVDLEPLLKAARGEGAPQGEFTNLFKTKTGDVKRFTPTNDEEEARVAAARTNKRGFVVEGIKGQVTNVNPTEAFWDAVTRVYDDEITKQLQQDPEVKNLVAASLAQGNARRPFVDPKPGGTNEPGGIVSASGHGFESGYRAAFRLKEVLEDIADVGARLDEAQGNGKPTDRLQARYDRLIARRQDLSEQALSIEPQSPAERRALAAAQRARDAQVAEQSGGAYRNESQRQVGRMTGLSEEELARKAMRDPSVLGRAAREGIEAGRVADPDLILKQIFEKFNNPEFAGRFPDKDEPSGYRTGPETTQQSLGRAFREVVGPLYDAVEQMKGPDKRLNQQVLGDVGRTIFGESEKYERPENAQQRVNTRDKAGGLLNTANEEAARAAALMDAGKGRGRVAKTLGSSRTGASTSGGAAEMVAEVMRPATSLDAERQGLGKQYEAEARKIAQRRYDERKAELDATGKNVGDNFTSREVDDFMYGPAIKKRGSGKTIARNIQPDVRAEVESNTAAGKRTKQIRDTQAYADQFLESISSMQDINAQRGAAETFPLKDLPEGVDEEEVRTELAELLKNRTAGEARSAYTRDTKDPVSGDAMRKRYRDKGGVVAGSDVESAPFAAFNAGGPAPETPGSRSARDLLQAAADAIIPVRVTNWPEGMAAGGGGGGGRRRGGDEQPADPGDSEPKGKKAKELRRKRIADKSAGTVHDTGKVYSFLPDDSEVIDQLTPIGGKGQGNAYHTGAAPTTTKAETSYARAEAARESRENIAFQKQLRAAAEKDAAAALQPGRGPAKPKTGIIGTPSRDRAIEEARRAGLDFNFTDPRGVSGLLTAPPSAAVLQANSARQRAQRSLPQRAIGTSVIQIAENLFGGLEGPQNRLAILANRTQDVNRLAETSTRQREGRLALLSERRQLLSSARAIEAGGGDASQTRARASGLGVEFAALSKQARQTNKALEEGATEVEGLAKSAVTGSDILRNLAAGAIGGIAGGLATGLISQAIGGVTQAATEVLGPVVERLSGFAGTTGRVQEGLASGFRSTNDDRTATLAQVGIGARLSTAQLDLIKEPLGERAATIAGTQSLAQQRDLFNAGRNISSGKEGGYDRALFRPTGGLFDYENRNAAIFSDISIGGQASTAETLAGSIRDLTTRGQLDRTTNPNIFDNLRDVGINIGDNLQTRQANDEALRAKLLDENNVQLKGLNDNLKGSKFSISDTGATEAELKAQEKLFGDAGVSSLGEALKDAGLTVQGLSQGGNAVQEVGEFLKTFNQGPQLDVQQLLDLNERQRSAQIQGRRAQLDFDVSQIPLQRAQQQATQPLGRADAGVKFSKNDSPEQVKRLNTDLEATQTHYDNINTEIDLGIQKSKEFVASAKGIRPQDAAAYGTAIDKVRSISLDISKIQIGDETKQAAFQAKQFDYQIYLAKRNLQDAKGLVSGVGNNLGAVERQMFDLQRQSQALSLGQNQRQINFQVAAAGFQAPGLTSEERQARIEDAKLQASYAQKQLDIQKKLYGLSGKQFDIGAARQVEDLSKQISLLTEGRSIALDVQVDQKKIKGLEADLAGAQAEASTYYNAALGFTSDVMAQATVLVAATGEALTTVANQVIAAFSKTISGITTQLNRLSDTRVNPATGQTYVGDPQQDYNGTTNAGGFLGTVSGTTSLGNLGVAGESAGEAVAIVKNPQQLMTPLGGGGAATTININVTGNKFTSEDDESRIMGKIVRAVEEAQARKGALIGLRPFGG